MTSYSIKHFTDNRFEFESHIFVPKKAMNHSLMLYLFIIRLHK